MVTNAVLYTLNANLMQGELFSCVNIPHAMWNHCRCTKPDCPYMHTTRRAKALPSPGDKTVINLSCVLLTCSFLPSDANDCWNRHGHWNWTGTKRTHTHTIDIHTTLALFVVQFTYPGTMVWPRQTRYPNKSALSWSPASRGRGKGGVR